MKRHLSLTAVLALAVPCAFACDKPKEAKIEVKVLAILASEHHTDVDPLLEKFAKHVQQKAPKLTGFKLARTTVESLKLGETNKFNLVGAEVVEVTVNKERNEEGRITLTIKPPGLDQITYACACSKFFSVATQHYVGKGKDKQQLFIAVMASPCTQKK